MSYLLRVQLPDVPGSLGRLASAIGDAGANIDAIEIVGRDNAANVAIDDVFIAPDPGVMPDSIVSACTSLEGVRVLWISRYAAGGNLFLDLEAVESMTQNPAGAVERLVDVVTQVFRVDWGVHLRRDGDHALIVHGTGAAPEKVPDGVAWPANVEKAQRIDVPAEWEDLVVAGSPLNADELVVVGRRGGPQFLDSEIARLAHLVAMAASLRRNA
ncbi:ACT domain-containing protein [Marmoricola sp. RAF53]|uniref:ACT domain-containing protein n=1 Tax=Marmoricola sp. RAF53 TaxID=3233059 RepID=UPI003F9586CD